MKISRVKLLTDLMIFLCHSYKIILKIDIMSNFLKYSSSFNKLFVVPVILILIATGIYGQDYPDDFYNSVKKVLKSEVLGSDRLLFIYLPNDYVNDTFRSYPVHYLTDAPLSSNLYFDLLRLHSVANELPQGIVVGLSSDDRDRNLNPEIGAGKYLEFIRDEVIPFIEKNYRTKPFRVLAGHSLGGGFVFYSMLKQPELFNAYIAGSPGPPDAILSLLEEEFKIEEDGYRYLFTSMGSEDLSDTLTFRRIEDKIKQKTGDPFDVHFKINNGEDHFSNLVITQQEAIRTLYRDWKYVLPDELNRPVSQDLKAHYDQLERKFGYRPIPDERTVIFPIMDQLGMKRDFENAIDLLKYDISLNPDSDQAYACMAMAHFDSGKPEQGMKYLEKALELNPENSLALRIKSIIDMKQR